MQKVRQVTVDNLKTLIGGRDGHKKLLGPVAEINARNDPDVDLAFLCHAHAFQHGRGIVDVGNANAGIAICHRLVEKLLRIPGAEFVGIVSMCV